MRRGGGKPDLNQEKIVLALRAAGASVLVASQVGHGFPDLVVGCRGRTLLLEIKNTKNSYGRRGMSERQKLWAAQWRGAPPIVVTSVDAALQAIGVLPIASASA